MIGGERPIRYQSFPINPWEAFRRMEEEVNRVFGEPFSEVSSGYPPRNIWYNENGACVVAELPGVAQEDVEAHVVGSDTIVIKGSRRTPELPKTEKVVSESRQFGSFMRSVTLPFDIDEKGMKAELRDGLLAIFLPRREEEKPKKIDIQTH